MEEVRDFVCEEIRKGLGEHGGLSVRRRLGLIGGVESSYCVSRLLRVEEAESRSRSGELLKD